MKLTRDDWVDAAYEALLDGGPHAVAVATISKGLRATRGSFYHYFEDRDALLEAALDRWEHDAVDALIVRAADGDDPTTTLERLLEQVFREPTRLAAVERHLLAARVDIPAVGASVDRVIERRLTFLEECYRELGFTAADAADRASVAYMMFTGWLYLDPTSPESPVARSNETGDRLHQLVSQVLVVNSP